MSDYSREYSKVSYKKAPTKQLDNVIDLDELEALTRRFVDSMDEREDGITNLTRRLCFSNFLLFAHEEQRQLRMVQEKGE